MVKQSFSLHNFILISCKFISSACVNRFTKLTKSKRNKSSTQLAMLCFVLVFPAQVYSYVLWPIGGIGCYATPEEACQAFYDSRPDEVPRYLTNNSTYNENKASWTLEPVPDRDWMKCRLFTESGWQFKSIQTKPRYHGEYYLSPERGGTPAACAGNPCDPATGQKFSTEIDIPASESNVSFSRYYSTYGIGNRTDSIGKGWRHSYLREMDNYEAPPTSSVLGITSSTYDVDGEDNGRKACIFGWDEVKASTHRGIYASTTADYQNGICQIMDNDVVVAKFQVNETQAFSDTTLSHANTDRWYHTVQSASGVVYLFEDQSDKLTHVGSLEELEPEWVNVSNSSAVSLQQLEDGWLFTDTSGRKDKFNVDGKLVESTNQKGHVTTYSYSGGQLSTVTNAFGQKLEFAYNTSNQLEFVTGPAGVISYQYTNDKLTRVDYPDENYREYLYENNDYPYHLTGIIDENGNRYASWSYDADGRALSSEHAGGAERVVFNYDDSNGTTTVTESRGAERVYHFSAEGGDIKVKKVTGDRCTRCSNPDMKERTYTSDGYLESFIDWNGNVTKLGDYSNGNPRCRVEGISAEDSNAEVCGFDPIASPDARLINYVYDTNFPNKIKGDRSIF